MSISIEDQVYWQLWRQVDHLWSPADRQVNQQVSGHIRRMVTDRVFDSVLNETWMFANLVKEVVKQ